MTSKNRNRLVVILGTLMVASIAVQSAAAQDSPTPKKHSKFHSFLSGLSDLATGTASAMATAGGYDVPTMPTPAETTTISERSNYSAAENYQTSTAQSGTSYAQTASQCTRTSYESGNLWIVNSCGEALTVKFTSDSGNAWGQASVGASDRAMVSASGVGYNPRTDGHVYLFACPQGFQPVTANGGYFFPNDYKGMFHCQK